MIIDTIQFNGEARMLEFHLNCLDPFVERFVIVEGETTFQGEAKPLVFPAIEKSIAKFAAKIDYVSSPAIPGESINPWYREHFQRDMAWGPVAKYPDDALVIVSDVDEIADVENFPIGIKEPFALRPEWYYYYANLRVGRFDCMSVATVKDIREKCSGRIAMVRDWRNRFPYFDNGWHFSYFGGGEAILSKLKAFSHSEYAHCADLKWIEEALSEAWKRGVDVLKRPGNFNFELIKNPRLPAYLEQNKEHFKDWFLPCDD